MEIVRTMSVVVIAVLIGDCGGSTAPTREAPSPQTQATPAFDGIPRVFFTRYRGIVSYFVLVKTVKPLPRTPQGVALILYLDGVGPEARVYTVHGSKRCYGADFRPENEDDLTGRDGERVDVVLRRNLRAPVLDAATVKARQRSVARSDRNGVRPILRRMGCFESGSGAGTAPAPRRDESAAARPLLRFTRPPIVVVDTYSDGTKEYPLVTAAVRTGRALPLNRRRYLQGEISVEGVVSADPTGRVGRRGRNCYSTSPIELPESFGEVTAGRVVTVELTLRDGSVARARVRLRDGDETRSPFWRELGCGGRKT